MIPPRARNFPQQLAMVMCGGTEADAVDLITTEAIETGGVFALGDEVRIELHDIVGSGASVSEAVAAWLRAATLQIAEATLRAVETDQGQREAAHTILRLSTSASWRAAAQDILDQLNGRAA
ncbi:hypothetical protein [Maritimibacter sp. DP1N21-5]|uniref:hypothetical protein n=1 Tax=Maritimibacter sp. DP1N21-5 TaxID=2836867 RepID=UPI001C444716|nr:hypothetical protein [Maritimibacter sp. DP1N21-5]MBV7408180.1 hypothetical protein [Maritimibacter sp. DP1N21-5]